MNLPGGGLRSIDNSRIPDRTAVRIEKNVVVEGRGKVGVVENVEHLCAELKVGSFRNLPQVGVLEQGEVHVDQTRSSYRIPPAVAEQSVNGSATGSRSLRGRHGETLQ